MSWIKRNLLFAIIGAMSVVLLLLAVFYNFTSFRHNSQAFAKLNETYGNLKQLADQKPSAVSTNIALAREQEQQLNDWIKKANGNFQPIDPVPPLNQLTSDSYANTLRRVLDQLQHEADTANVAVPPQYSFSFQAERSSLRFAPGSLAPLATQLGEVKTICEVLFASRVNALDQIQRVRVSDDDAAGTQTDYIDDSSVTNDTAVLTPYAITFRCFSAELATVLDNLASSSHGFVVAAVNVTPASAEAGAIPGNPAYGNPAYGNPAYGNPAYGNPMATPQSQMARGASATVLKEQLLRVTLKVEIVKLKK